MTKNDKILAKTIEQTGLTEKQLEAIWWKRLNKNEIEINFWRFCQLINQGIISL